MQHDIICDDTRRVLRGWTAERRPGWCDAVVTSPPYNIGMDYGRDADGRKICDSMSPSEYHAFSRDWLWQVRDALKNDGHLFLNVGAVPRAPMRPFEVLYAAVNQGFVLQNTFHWVKSITIPGENGAPYSKGHFKPINSRRYVNDCHEYIFHLTPKGDSPLDKLAVGVPYADKSNIKRRGHAQDLRCAGNNWFIPYKTIQSSNNQRPHPATFPKELAARCLLIAGSPKTVLDPFCGIGNTGLAAAECGAAAFFGVDLSPAYVQEALKRLSAPKSDELQ